MVLPRINPDLLLAAQLPVVDFTYTERDVALYALGVGAQGADACNPTELPFLYHPDGQSSIKVLPTFAVLFANDFVVLLSKVPGLHFDRNLLLHGEQYLEVYKPLPTHGNIRSSIRISGLQDKVKAAVLELEILSHNIDTGDVLCMNRITVFLRGAGGFSTSSPPFSYSDRKSQLNLTPLSKPSIPAQELPPDIVIEEQTHPSQALLYRLSGDYNPLHSDPSYAKAAGFPRPILHGLCTFGYATRAVIQLCCGGEPTLVRSVQGRFLLHVFPGETLVTEIWENKKESVATFKVKVKERGKVVLSGTVRLHPRGSRL
ncbi:unnamed protein product [Sphagnum balticum]